MDNKSTNETIARILVSTKRKSRQYSLYEIASDILYLKDKTGGLNAASKLIGISPGMLNQFLSVFKLPIEILDLVKQRKIDSVSVAHTLSKFNHDDALQLAEQILLGEITSQELRIILPYRRKNPNGPIVDIIRRVLESKDIKVSVIRLPKSNMRCSILELEKRVIDILGKENLLALETTNTYIDVKITSNGEKLFRQKAKEKGLSFQAFITTIIS